jgi:membrane dipeptidase
MRRLHLLAALLITINSIGQSPKKIHAKAIVVDGHNDVLTETVLEGVDISKRHTQGHSDLERWKEGGLDVQFFSVWTGERPRNKEGFYRDATQEIDSLNLVVLRNPDGMVLARNYREVKKGIRQGKLVALIGVEGGHMIEDDLAKLESLYNLDMRYMTLTWNNSTSWASSAMDETERPDLLKHKGLNEFGKRVVRKMNELGIIVDLSHTGEQTFYDAIATTSKPVILSHSSVWSICPTFRNVKDDQIRAVAKNGGVICINFFAGFINKDFNERADYLNNKIRKGYQDSLLAINPDSTAMRTAWRQYFRSEMKQVHTTIDQLIDHIDHIVRLVGDDYVGLGSDYDGVSTLPVGLEDVSTYPKITEALVKRGYSKKSIQKILGGNVMRVMKANFR